MKPFFLAELKGSVAMFWRQLSLKQQLLPPTLFSEVSFSVIIKKQNLLFLHCQKNSEKTKPRGLCFFSHQISVNHGYLFQNVCNTIQHYYGPNLVFISGGFFLVFSSCMQGASSWRLGAPGCQRCPGPGAHFSQHFTY